MQARYDSLSVEERKREVAESFEHAFSSCAALLRPPSSDDDEEDEEEVEEEGDEPPPETPRAPTGSSSSSSRRRAMSVALSGGDMKQLRVPDEVAHWSEVHIDLHSTCACHVSRPQRSCDLPPHSWWGAAQARRSAKLTRWRRRWP